MGYSQHDPGCCCGGCTYFKDTFNRADNTNLGADWTEVDGSWEIASNKLVCTSPGRAKLSGFPVSTNPSASALARGVTFKLTAPEDAIIRIGEKEDFYPGFGGAPVIGRCYELKIGASGYIKQLIPKTSFPYNMIAHWDCNTTALLADEEITISMRCGALFVNGEIIFNVGYEHQYPKTYLFMFQVVAASGNVLFDDVEVQDHYASNIETFFNIYDEPTPEGVPGCPECPPCQWFLARNEGELPATVVLDIIDYIDGSFGTTFYYWDSINGSYNLTPDGDSSDDNYPCRYSIDELNILVYEDDFVYRYLDKIIFNPNYTSSFYDPNPTLQFLGRDILKSDSSVIDIDNISFGSYLTDPTYYFGDFTGVDCIGDIVFDWTFVLVSTELAGTMTVVLP